MCTSIVSFDTSIPTESTTFFIPQCVMLNNKLAVLVPLKGRKPNIPISARKSKDRNGTNAASKSFL